MRTSELKNFVRAASAIVARDPQVAQFEIYGSSADQRIARLNYTSDIPCRGVEELKSHDAGGFQIRIAMLRNPREIGTAFEAGDFSAEAIKAVLARAHRAAIVDPNFPGFPTEPRKLVIHKPPASDLARADDRVIVESAWSIIRGAMQTLARPGESARPNHLQPYLPNPCLVLGGDITLTRDRIATANSNFADIRGDEAAHFSSSITALVESIDGKGTAALLGRSIAEMRSAGSRLGREAVANALKLCDGAHPPGGEYRVVLGPQPVAEILNYMVMGSLSTGAFHAASSAYHGRFGSQVMDARLSLADDPLMRRASVIRAVTCEGLPARKTELIHNGRLVGLLSNFYDGHRLAADPNSAEKLGVDNAGMAFAPNAGYRLGEGGTRRFDQSPASTATNVVMKVREGVGENELIRRIGDGLYIGRVWYTYPINGQRSGDFTCTVSGDSYVIRDGKIAAPLAPNALRINSNLDAIFSRIIAGGKRLYPAIVWGAPETFYVSAIACGQVTVAAVGRQEASE